MKKKIIGVLVLMLMVIPFIAPMKVNAEPLPGTLYPINNLFPDTNLAEEMVNVFGKVNVTDMVTQGDFDLVTTLDLSSLSITNIEGLQYFDNLEYLSLADNNISDISKLSGLTSLQGLDLAQNVILSNISALSGLVNLEYLYLYENDISDITALSGLINLIELDLSRNNISNISVLNGLTSLGYLNVSSNHIADLTLSGFTGDISANDQTVAMTKKLTSDGKLIITNPFKYVNGDIMAPDIISHGGIYDPITNTITWVGVVAGSIEGFEFGSFGQFQFDGEATVTALAYEAPLAEPGEENPRTSDINTITMITTSLLAIAGIGYVIYSARKKQ